MLSDEIRRIFAVHGYFTLVNQDCIHVQVLGAKIAIELVHGPQVAIGRQPRDGDPSMDINKRASPEIEKICLISIT